MTVASPALRASRRRLEPWSIVAVVALTAASVLAGLVLRTSVAEGSRRVELDGSSVDVPAGWIVAAPIGDALLSVRDPLDPDQRYVVERYDPAGLALDDAARHRLTDRSGLLDGFSLIEDAAASVGGVTTHRLRYTFADASATPAVVVEALEDHFAAGDRIVVVRLEAPQVGVRRGGGPLRPLPEPGGVLAGAGRDARCPGRRAPGRCVERDPSPDRDGRPIGLPLGRATVGATAADMVAATVQVQQIAPRERPVERRRVGLGDDPVGRRAHPDQRPRGDAERGRTGHLRPRSDARPGSGRARRRHRRSRGPAGGAPLPGARRRGRRVPRRRAHPGRPEPRRQPDHPGLPPPAGPPDRRFGRAPGGRPADGRRLPGHRRRHDQPELGRGVRVPGRRPDRLPSLDQDRRGRQPRQLGRSRGRRLGRDRRDPDPGPRRTSAATRWSGRSAWSAR